MSYHYKVFSGKQRPMESMDWALKQMEQEMGDQENQDNIYDVDEKKLEKRNWENIYQALSSCQSELDIVVKNKKGYGYTYTDLGQLWSVIRQPLTSNGLSIHQTYYKEDEMHYMRTTLMHEKGGSLETVIPVFLDSSKKMNPMQALGSAITYARRYGIQTCIGMASEDDDGKSSGKSPDDNKRQQPPQQQRQMQPQQRQQQQPRHQHDPNKEKYKAMLKAIFNRINQGSEQAYDKLMDQLKYKPGDAEKMDVKELILMITKAEEFEKKEI